MTLTTKTRLGKRKLEIKEVRKENQKETSKKHDRKCLEFSERSTKDVLLKQLRVLQEKIVELDKEKKATEENINKLKAENDKQNEKNQCLEEQIVKLVNEMKSNTSQPNVVKTDTGDIIMFCNECEYPAEDIYDLGEHMYEIHSSRYEGEGEDCFVCEICNDRFISSLELTAHAQKHHGELGSKDSMESNSLACNFCEEKFVKHGDLMSHKKKKHGNKVAICWKFLAGNCIFGDASCWFLHSESEESCTTPEWKCNLCDNEFRCQSELLRHKKEDHGHLVQMCRNEVNGKCIYGSQDCWFRHDIRESAFESETSRNEKNEVIEKVFGMLEKMTQRILQIENYNLTK
jgi:hypothetical protein